MRSSNHDPINWGDLTHDHITQYFWVPFATYMGKYSRNKTKVKFDDVNSSALKKSAKSLKKLRQLLLSRIHPKSVQVQKRYFSGNLRAIRNKSRKRKQSEANGEFSIIKWLISLFLLFYLFRSVILMLLITKILYDTNIYVISYTLHNLMIINQDMVYWHLNPVLHTCEDYVHQ